MEYPTLYVKEKTRQMSDAFLGYNHNLRIGDGEFYDMKNMTSDHYPVLAPRSKRGLYAESELKFSVEHYPQQLSSLIVNEKLCYVDGPDLVCGDHHINLNLQSGPKQLIAMGAYVIVMPDKKAVLVSEELYLPKDIDAEFTSTEDIEFTLCTIDGSDYDTEGKDSETAPENPENGQLWIDTSSTPHTLMKYSEVNKKWVAIATTYIKISTKGIGVMFAKYDGVTISGVVDDALSGLNGSMVIWERGGDYIVVTGILDKTTTQPVEAGKITVQRKMPKVDYVFECGNRLWACKYGKAGSWVNEIYASKLGDFTNWNCVMGISTDSWVGSVGSDGPFTGAIAFRGNPLFFKENCVHKVYGDVPSNFRLQITECRGVQQGSSNSLSIVNETLFYKARDAVCAYDGSLPSELSLALGNARYGNAVAGCHGDKYYISMEDTSGNYHLFVYDIAKGLWHKEDDIRVEAFCSHRGEMYAIVGNKIIAMLGSGTPMEQSVNWMVQSGTIGMDMPDMKYVSKLTIRMSLALGSRVQVCIQYDSVGDWEQVCQMTSTSLRSFSVPIRPRRCDHFRIRIEGEGDGRIYSITRTLEKGSDFS